MVAEVIVVHPTVIMVQAGSERHEVPTGWFPVLPKIGQRWDIRFVPIKTSTEQYALLNGYLSRG